MKQIVHTSELAQRMPEHGRIRIGVKAGKAMKSIDTFRFTSTDETALATIAATYGGTVRPWSDPLASPSHQFEVITTTAEVPVFLPPGGLSVWYEAWGKTGIDRRCDGVNMVKNQGLDTPFDFPCQCDRTHDLACRPTTRLSVILPFLRFGGVWRLESKGWNAAQELSSMEATIVTLQDQAQKMLRAALVLEQRTKRTTKGTKHFVVPKLVLDASPEDMLAGLGAPTAVALARPDPVALTVGAADVEVVDAELVDGDDVNPKEWADRIQAKYQPAGDDVTARAHDAADEVGRRWPFMGPEGAKVLAWATATLSKGATTTFADLDEAAQRRIQGMLQDMLDGVAEATLVDGKVRVVKRSR